MSYFDPGPKQTLNAILPTERSALLNYVGLEETVDYSLQVLALRGAEQGLFFLSASTVRKVLIEEEIMSDRRPKQRRSGSGRKPDRPAELTGPNQCWTWDISYLRTDLPRIFWYLFVMLDEWSRKVIAWRVADHMITEEAQGLIDDAFLAENLMDVPRSQLPVVVNDRGSQMKAKPVKQMFLDLGLVQTFARPRTPNDNPFIESLFSTVKSAPTYPECFPSETIKITENYFEKYFGWYNSEHYHSGIGYVHPIDKHEGRAPAILKERKENLKRQRLERRSFWINQSQISENQDVVSSLLISNSRHY
ncbi:MAG: DDE-type integrase/transposase/recombinase [Candidatus Marinimicrobia bacterium]|nr:DDE-type integrase/transposase/recombinase [Candidatus Neomarinimicrobiota bacterium]